MRMNSTSKRDEQGNSSSTIPQCWINNEVVPMDGMYVLTTVNKSMTVPKNKEERKKMK